jgi:hypothetical protein
LEPWKDPGRDSYIDKTEWRVPDCVPSYFHWHGWEEVSITISFHVSPAKRNSFWRLGCFTLHRHFSSSEAQDGLYHQRQAILRNSDTAQDGAWRLLTSMLAWRAGARARKPIFRLLPLIVLAFAISAAFGVASIFSSNVTSETLNQVLLKGTRCAAMNKEKGSVYKQLTQALPYHAARATKFLNYGLQCYTGEKHTDGCNTYLKPRLPLVSTRGISCPFGDDICKLDSDNLMMDTGYLDSLDDLGINSAPNERFQLRMVHQCAPLKTQGYTQDFNDSTYGAVKQAMYGSVATVKGNIDWTYQVPVNNAYVPDNGNSTSSNIPRLEYQLGSQQHYATPNESLFDASVNDYSPIPALHLPDADVHLAFLSAPEIHFSNPIDDPLFSAHKSASGLKNEETHEMLDAYLQDEPLAVMACTQQIQYCNPNLPEADRCEPLRGLIDPRRSTNLHKIFPEDAHFAAIKWADYIWTGSVYTISGTLGFIGASALRARYSLSYGYSGPLPDNQWQLEAEHWVKAELASLQDVFVTAANGMPSEMDDFRVEPMANETIARNMCVNQKIVSTTFSSFNVLGLSLILVLGALIIVLDMGLEPCVARWVKRKYAKRQSGQEEEGWNGERHPLYEVVEWSQMGTLQLQRLAHEEAGSGTWTKCDGDVPVTEPGQLVASLNLNDVEHPLLKQQKLTPASGWEEVVPFKPRGLRRSDTGMDTLVEDAETEKEGKKTDLEADTMPMTFHAIGVTVAERELGLGVRVQDESADRQQEWRALR